MVNVDDFKRFVEFVSNKSGKGGYLSPSEFNLNAQRAVMEFTMKRYGNVHEYQPGRPIPRFSYEKTQKVIDDLRHLKEQQKINVVGGKMPIPDGTTVTNSLGVVVPKYLHLSTLTYSKITNSDCSGFVDVRKKSIEMVKDDELAVRCDSDLVPPTLDYPIGNIQKEHIDIYPKQIAQADIVYLRQPNNPVWGFNVVSNRPVYDASTSTDLDIPYEAMNEVAMMFLSYLGLRIRDTDVLQYAEMQKSKGV